MILGSALTSSGAFYILANIIINTKVKIQNITILNDAISITLRDIINAILNNLTTIGIVTAIIGVVIIIGFAFIKSYTTRETKKEEQ